MNSFLFDVLSFSFLLKSVLFTKLATLLLLNKFACFNHAENVSAVNSLNSWVVIYLLLWSWSVISFPVSLVFGLQSVFLTKLRALGISFSTSARAVVLPKLVVLGISPLTSFISTLRAAVVAKLVILGISPLTSFIWAF